VLGRFSFAKRHPKTFTKPDIKKHLLPASSTARRDDFCLLET
jgi:hypothetical protein